MFFSLTLLFKRFNLMKKRINMEKSEIKGKVGLGEYDFLNIISFILFYI